MAVEVIFNNRDDHTPIRVELKKDVAFYFTKKSAIELKHKLSLAIDEMHEHEDCDEC